MTYDYTRTLEELHLKIAQTNFTGTNPFPIHTILGTQNL